MDTDRTQTRPSPPEGPPPPSPPDLIADFGRYRLERLLGRGGMGAVLLAWDSQLGRHVALKLAHRDVLDDAQGRARFLREARLSARLRHPNIVGIHDVGEVNGRPYFTMDRLEGRTWQELRDERRAAGGASTAGPDGLREEVELLAAVAEAIEHAHGQGVLHRDLKPANVILVPRPAREGEPAGAPVAWHPVVTDFGLARDLADADPAVTKDLRTHTGEVLGTPNYMSPEQAAGDRERIGPRCDVWSLGVILYEALTGRRPFVAENPWNLLTAIREDEPVPPDRLAPQAPPALTDVCLRALEKDPSRRTPSASAFAADLRRWLRGEGVEARRVSAPGRAWRRIVRRRAALAWTVAGVSILVVLLVWAGIERKQRRGRTAEVLEEVAASVSRLEDSVMRTPLSAEDRDQLAKQPWGALERCLAEDPDDPDGIAWRGRLKALLGDLRGAEADFAHAIARAPGSATARFLRGMHNAIRYWSARGLPGFTLGAEGLVREVPRAESNEERAWREQAIEDLAQAGAADPAAADPVLEARRQLGRAQVALLSERAEDVAEALALARTLPGPGARRVEGMALHFSQQLEAAEAAFGRVVEEWPLDALSWQMRAFSRLGVGASLRNRRADPRETYRAAVADFDRALALLPQHPGIRSGRGSALLLLAQAMAERGEDATGVLQHALEDFEAEARLRPQATDSLGNRAVAHFEIGRAALELGADGRPHLERALDDLDAALRIGPDPRLLHNRARVRFALASSSDAEAGRHAQAALADCEEALRREPADPAGYLMRSAAHRALADCVAGADPLAHLRQAIEDAGTALRDADAPEDACRERAQALLSLAERESRAGSDPRQTLAAALADIDAARLSRPWDPSLPALRGTALVRLGESELARGSDARATLDQAVRECDDAIARAPAGLAARITRATAWSRLGEADLAGGKDPRPYLSRALEEFDVAIRLAPGRANARSGRGAARMMLARAIDSAGEDPRAQIRLALEDLALAVERDPGHVEGWLNRGGATLSLAAAEGDRGGDPRELCRQAIADLDRAVAMRPQDASGYINRGGAYACLGTAEANRGEDPRPSYRRALAEYDAALARYSVDPEIYHNRGRVRRLLAERGAGDAEETRTGLLEALADLDEAVCLEPRAQFLRERAVIWHRMGKALDDGSGRSVRANTRRAQADLDAAGSGNLATALEALGEFDESLGRLQEAAQAFEFVARRAPERATAARERIGALGERLARDLPIWERTKARINRFMHFGDYATARRRLERDLALARLGLDRLPADERDRRLEDPEYCTLMAELHYVLGSIESVLSTGRLGPGAEALPIPAETREAGRARAFELLREAVRLGMRDAARVRADADVDPIRDDSRFPPELK